jgi:hypothetical protein
MRRNLLIKSVVALMFLLVFGISAMACEVEFKVSDKSKKAVYSSGDELVVELKVVLVHRGCNVSVEDTKLDAAGCKITGATKWTETSPGVFERKLKVQVLTGSEKEMQISCRRSCDKDGGSGKIVLKKQS